MFLLAGCATPESDERRISVISLPINGGYVIAGAWEKDLLNPDKSNFSVLYEIIIASDRNLNTPPLDMTCKAGALYIIPDWVQLNKDVRVEVEYKQVNGAPFPTRVDNHYFSASKGKYILIDLDTGETTQYLERPPRWDLLEMRDDLGDKPGPFY